jgi:hypothetical protein
MAAPQRRASDTVLPRAERTCPLGSVKLNFNFGILRFHLLL